MGHVDSASTSYNDCDAYDLAPASSRIEKSRRESIQRTWDILKFFPTNIIVIHTHEFREFCNHISRTHYAIY